MSEHSGETRPPIIRGESEWFWSMGHPWAVWPFRCKARLDPTLRCRRGRKHGGPHWARDVWWTDSGQVQDDRRLSHSGSIEEHQ